MMDYDNDMVVIEHDQSDLVIAENNTPNTIEADFNTARANIYSILEKGKEGLNVALELVRQTEAPRAIEVFANLVKTLTDVNVQILDIQRKKQELDGTATPSDSPHTVNQTAIFAGTTSDLAKALKDLDILKK